jgi:hypothetical protein
MNNVHLLRQSSAHAQFRKQPFTCNDGDRRGAVLPFDRTFGDEAILRLMAPWIDQEIDHIKAWSCSLFMSRLAQQVDAAMGRPTISEISWQQKCPGWLRGLISTPFGTVIAHMSSSHLDAHARFEGSQAALIHAGIVSRPLLEKGPRKFESDVLGSTRAVRVNRNRDRRHISFELTSDEYAEISAARLDGLDDAKTAVRQAVAAMPTSIAEYKARFLRRVSITADMLTREACHAEGGFSLDADSRAAMLAQLDVLRDVVRKASIAFDRNERVSDISYLASKNAPALVTAN